MDSIKTVQVEMNPIVAERRIQNALSHKISLAGDLFYEADEEDVVYSKTKKERVKSLIVVQAEGIMLVVQILNRG